MTEPTLIPLTDTEALRGAGVVYPATEHGWRWLYRMRRERGLERVFVRVGGRILIDTAAYLSALRSRPAA